MITIGIFHVLLSGTEWNDVIYLRVEKATGAIFHLKTGARG
jgi:hypothetical protein